MRKLVIFSIIAFAYTSARSQSLKSNETSSEAALVLTYCAYMSQAIIDTSGIDTLISILNSNENYTLTYRFENGKFNFLAHPKQPDNIDEATVFRHVIALSTILDKTDSITIPSKDFFHRSNVIFFPISIRFLRDDLEMHNIEINKGTVIQWIDSITKKPLDDKWSLPSRFKEKYYIGDDGVIHLKHSGAM